MDLQRAAGSQMRNILRSIAKNRFLGVVLTGVEWKGVCGFFISVGK